ncbi:MAG: glycosyltransferase family 2 protein, partial [Flavobacteriales bacterium]|nr:glycosyltransferase family 2 protein [Flavobacteriales bacterium]
MELALIIVYGVFLTFIFFYSLIQLSLAVRYNKHKNDDESTLPKLSDEAWPFVTIQLPVFNELYVVERLIDAIVALDYPKERLEIQLLDDGNDESVQLAAAKIALLREAGFPIEHIRRSDRVGYKAGALAYGLSTSKGEFTAIFDADFIPNPDFLRRTIPHFLQDDNIGVVQAKWEHLNQDFSTLTRLQAFGLDAHFTVEQVGRNLGGHFINFNGTAGVWRKSCIIDAGGWQSDTITEDLDLSYRAQLKGWRFVYLENVGAPAELPAEMNALKSQQFRWTTGAAECAVKNLPKVLKKRGLGLGTKVHAVFHLLNSFIFICVLSTALLSLPMLVIKANSDRFDMLFNIASIFLLSFLILGYFYWSAQSNRKGKLKYFLRDFPMFLSVSMGLSLHNSIAVLEGYMGKKTPFVRTPKFALNEKKGSWLDKKY